MLAHPNITISLGTMLTGAFLLDASARAGTPFASHQIIYSGPIDGFFDYRFGRLPYRSAQFQFQTLNQPQHQPVGVVNYPSENINFTRVIEFKHLTGQQHPKTTIAFEYPTADGEPYWPVPTASSAALYRRYAALAAEVAPQVRFAGRMGTYRYLNIDQAVAQALKTITEILEQEAQNA